MPDCHTNDKSVIVKALSIFAKAARQGAKLLLWNLVPTPPVPPVSDKSSHNPDAPLPDFIQRLPAPLRTIALWPRQLYAWMMKMAAGKHAEKALAAVSFAESSFFPIPPDVMLIPMILAQRDKAYRFALVCTIASVLGGLLGYAIGYFLQPVGMAILDFFGYGKRLDGFKAFMEQWGMWVILAKGLTPIPFKLVTIASGLAQFNLAVFIASCVVTRGARFFLVAFLCKRYGAEITEMIEKRFYLVGTVAVILIVLGVVAIKLIPH